MLEKTLICICNKDQQRAVGDCRREDTKKTDIAPKSTHMQMKAM